jgi:hypothetical protein
MLALIALAVVVALATVNVHLLREHARLRRRTLRLAMLARDNARRVRSMDSATEAAFEQVQMMLAEPEPTREPEPEPEAEPAPAPRRPTFLN